MEALDCFGVNGWLIGLLARFVWVAFFEGELVFSITYLYVMVKS